MCNIVVMVSGSGTNLCAIIDAVNSGKINGHIKAVISSKAEAFAIEHAKQNNIPAYFIKNDAAKILEVLSEVSAELIVLAGYLPVLSAEVVGKYKNKIINVHPSLIPKYCGKGFYGIHVHKAVLAAKEKTTGATIHYVDGEIDTGPIIMQEEIIVLENDTPETLQKRVLALEHELLIKAIDNICSGGQR